MKRSKQKRQLTEEEKYERNERKKKQKRDYINKKRAQTKAQSTEGYLKDKLEKEAKRSWPYTLLPDFTQIFRVDPKCNNLYHELLANGFCILSIDTNAFELLQMNIKSIKRVHNAADRPTHLYSELETPAAIFDAPDSVGWKPRRMAKFKGGHSEASTTEKEKYPNTTCILSILKKQILGKYVPHSLIKIVCRYDIHKPKIKKQKTTKNKKINKECVEKKMKNKTTKYTYFTSDFVN